MWRQAAMVVMFVVAACAGLGTHSVNPAPSASTASPGPFRPASGPVDHPSGETGERPIGAPSATGNVTFEESGLPPTTPWEVITTPYAATYESENSTRADELNETLPDGLYNLTEEADLPNYEAYGDAGQTNVTGGEQILPVKFWLGYTLTFDAVGLPFNVSWNVSVAAEGVTQNRTVAGNTTQFRIPAGNYSYRDTSVGFGSNHELGASELTDDSTVVLDFVRPAPTPGVLAAKLNVPAAEFFLNGILHQEVPSGTIFFNLTPGFWVVFVQSPGYLAYYNTTSIQSNRTVQMDVTLIPVTPSPGPPLLSAFADVIVIALVAGIAVLVILFFVAGSRFTRR